MRPPAGVALAVCLLPLFARAEGESARSLSAVRTHTPPAIDGRLDDAGWAEAHVDDRFTQISPSEKQAPSERTELRVLYDDEALYVGVRCFDHDPDKIVARLTRRDRSVESDWVGFLVDSRNDHSSGYAFRVNAAGVQLDSMWFNDNNESTDWDAVWSSAVRRDAEGWSAEFRIPLSVLRFSSRDAQEWGFQVVRYISRKKETDFWNYIPSTVQGFVSKIGRMDGLFGLRPRRTFEMRPYVASRVTASSSSGGALLGLSPGASSDYAVDGGLDLKLGITSDLTLDATVNPDFGQVEADQVVLNLSRFESFFPEKRPFFLEGTDLFATPVQMFYSRRIGRPPTGLAAGDYIVTPGGAYLEVASAPRALRIWSAGKLAGKLSSKLQIGALEAVTGAETATTTEGTANSRDVELTPERSFAVLRGRYDFGGSSYVGAMATAVNRLGGELYLAEANHDAFAQDLDAAWVLNENVRLQAQAMLSERAGGPTYETLDGTDCPAGRSDPDSCVPIMRADGTRMQPGAVGWGGFAMVRGEFEHALVMAQWKSLSSKLDLNDMGYVPNYDFHELRAFAGYRETKPKGMFQNFDSVLGGFVDLAGDGTLRQALNFWVLEGQLKNFWYFNFELDVSWPGAYDILETLDGGHLQSPFSYGGSLYFNTDSRKAVVASVGTHLFWGADDSYDFGGNAEIAFQIIPQLELSLTPELGTNLATRFYDCSTDAGRVCSVDDASHNYLFADLNSTYLSLTLRGTWTFSPRMSLQAYGQLFADRGSYDRYRMLSAQGEHPKLHLDDLAPTSYRGDSDGDGMKDDDFQDLSLNVNIVLRWEFYPGSTLIGVFTRAQNAAFPIDGRSPQLRLSGLGSGPTEDVLLMKLVYFIG